MTNFIGNEIAKQQKTLVFNCKGLDINTTLDIATLPDSSLLALLNYGTRKINDQFNSGKEKHGATQEYWDGLIEAVTSGTLASGQRAGALSADDKGIKELILKWLSSVCKIPAGRIKEVNKATNDGLVILDEIFSDKPEEWREETYGKFAQKWEQIKAVTEDDLGIDL